MAQKKKTAKKITSKEARIDKGVINFLYEVGMLAKTPRSGFFFLGSGDQSVAEHINRVSYLGFVLSSMSKDSIDMNKVLKMCLFHDIAEARVSDLNYVHQKYNVRKEHEAVSDLVSAVPFGKDIEEIISEYEKRETKEAKIAKDCDNLEFLLALKEQADIGNERALTWIPPLMKRFLTDEGRAVADGILSTDSDEWWFGNKNDKWWVNRNK